MSELGWAGQAAGMEEAVLALAAEAEGVWPGLKPPLKQCNKDQGETF